MIGILRGYFLSVKWSFAVAGSVIVFISVFFMLIPAITMHWTISMIVILSSLSATIDGTMALSCWGKPICIMPVKKHVVILARYIFVGLPIIVGAVLSFLLSVLFGGAYTNFTMFVVGSAFILSAFIVPFVLSKGMDGLFWGILMGLGVAAGLWVAVGGNVWLFTELDFTHGHMWFLYFLAGIVVYVGSYLTLIIAIRKGLPWN